MRKRLVIFLLGPAVVYLLSCSLPEGLEPVSGIEGNIQLKGSWPDTLFVATLIVLDELSLNSLEKDLISYGDPVLQGDTLSYYFIQLRPGGYYLVSIGLTIEPGLFFANLDSVLTAPELPVALLRKTLIDAVIPFAVQDGKISPINVTISF